MLFDRLPARCRRPVTARFVARGARPSLESMERRELLTTYMVIDNPRINEGTGGAGPVMNFTVRLTAPSTTAVTVDYQTVNRTAVAGSDFTAVAGTLTFAPGETVKKIPVRITPDSAVELNETFTVALSKAKNATIVTPTGAGTIMNDDFASPLLSIADVRMKRGLLGSRTMSFTVSLNAAQKTAVTVKASTADVTARAGLDYTAKTELLTFAAGQTTKTFSVIVNGTSTKVSDRVFLVNLTSTTADLTRGTAAGVLMYGS